MRYSNIHIISTGRKNVNDAFTYIGFRSLGELDQSDSNPRKRFKLEAPGIYVWGREVLIEETHPLFALSTLDDTLEDQLEPKQLYINRRIAPAIIGLFRKYGLSEVLDKLLKS